MIRWKLNEVMARQRVRNKDLAEALNITENSVYRLRKADEMPRLTPQRLDGICAILQCQPGDLLEWLPDSVSLETLAKDSLKILSPADRPAPPAIALQPSLNRDRQKVVPPEVFQAIAQYCDQALALAWLGYRQYGPGAVIYIQKADGPEIAYIESDKLPDPEAQAVIAQNQPTEAAVLLFYYSDDYDSGDYDVFTLSGPKSPPECYGLIYT